MESRGRLSRSGRAGVGHAKRWHRLSQEELQSTRFIVARIGHCLEALASWDSLQGRARTSSPGRDPRATHPRSGSDPRAPPRQARRSLLADQQAPRHRLASVDRRTSTARPQDDHMNTVSRCATHASPASARTARTPAQPAAHGVISSEIPRPRHHELAEQRSPPRTADIQRHWLTPLSAGNPLPSHGKRVALHRAVCIWQKRASLDGANTERPQRSGAPSRCGPRYASLREAHTYQIPINGLKARRLP